MSVLHRSMATAADAIVIGGGVAGITAAVALANAGLRIVLLERSSDLGGRARSVVEPVTGDTLPIGPHIVATEYHNFLKLLDHLGTRDEIAWQDGDFITIMEGYREIRMATSPLPAPFHFIPSLMRNRSISQIDWISNIPITLLALSLQEADIGRLDATPADEFIRRLKVSNRFREHFWAFTSNAVMNASLEACSAGALMRLYRRLIGHGEVVPGSLSLPSII